MHLDAQDLRTFYYRSALGRVVQRHIRSEVLRLWPGSAKGQTVVGYGFAVPLLRPFLPEARRVVALMPAPQGVMPWPAGLPNVSVLSEEVMWPLDTGVADRMILLHGLETSTDAPALMDEAHRVLGPGGRAIIIVPSRTGLWSRSDQTPFGYGRPYSTSQLEQQLKAHGFAIERHSAALYHPPSHKRFWLKTAPMWERIGQGAARLGGGVLLVEVSKHARTPKRPGLTQAVKRPLGVLEGLGVAEPQTRTPRAPAAHRSTGATVTKVPTTT